jgi:hypothetical protein
MVAQGPLTAVAPKATRPYHRGMTDAAVEDVQNLAPQFLSGAKKVGEGLSGDQLRTQAICALLEERLREIEALLEELRGP